MQTLRSTTFFICFSVALLAALACGVATAQVLYGSLTGNVTDPSNAAVPGAKVEALNVGTGVARQTTTDDRGSYLFNNLQFGVYKITIAAPAFRTVIENDIQVNANEVRRVDLHLQIVQASETIEVSAAVAALQTDKADVHAEITSQEVEELPYNGGEGKNFQSLLYLIPGAGIPLTPEANSEAGNPQRALTLFMNGVSSTGNSTKIDGATVAYPWLPVNVAYVPPVESIQTVNVSTNAFDAEQGAAGGVAVNVMIKSGTNQFHGVMFERNQVVGGFQISGTLSRYSGLPFTVNAPNSNLNAGGQTQTADQLKADVAILGGHDANTPYFDGSAFGAVNAARLGTSGRNILRGPGVFNTNINISRIITIKERLKLQILGEAFNATNTPSFANPGASVTPPTLNPDNTVRSYNGYTVITGTTSTARVIQVGATLRF